MIKALYLLGLLAVLAIAVLSLIPGNLQPHVAGSHYVHHFAAYVIAAIFLTLGPRKMAHLITIAVLLLLFAGMLEIAQLWIPSRNSRISDFVASSLGIWFGILGSFFCRSVLHRRDHSSSNLG